MTIEYKLEPFNLDNDRKVTLEIHTNGLQLKLNRLNFKSGGTKWASEPTTIQEESKIDPCITIKKKHPWQTFYAHELISVQPMTMPVSMTFFVDYKYTEIKTEEKKQQ